MKVTHLPESIASKGTVTGQAGEQSGKPEVGTTFSDLIERGVSRLNKDMDKANALATAVVTGQEVDLPKVVTAVNKADIEFKLFLQLRNRALGAYEEIMRLQF